MTICTKFLLRIIKLVLTAGLCLILHVNTHGQGSEDLLSIDHIILAVNDLKAGMEEFERMTGVKPVFGGIHPGNDTQNAIVPLSEDMYLEILAPTDDLDTIPDFFKDLHRLTLIGFALSSKNIMGLEQIIKEIEWTTNGIEAGSRKKPDGQLLEWQLLMVNQPALYINPFFIQWSAGSSHPAAQEMEGCHLMGLDLATPYESDINRLFKKTKTNIQTLNLKKGEFKLSMTLNTPKGQVMFGL